MAKTAVSLNPETFNYALLKSDVNDYCKREGYSQQYISKNILFRCDNYLSNALSKKQLPAFLLTPLCEMLGLKASRYKIEEEKPKPKPIVKAPEVVAPTSIPEQTNVELAETSTGWECRIKVDEDFETVMMKVLKNGEEMALSRCYFFSKDDIGIMQAISYAAHQCYKTYQQKEFAQQEVNHDLRQEVKDIVESTQDPDPNDARSFKNWILKYENEVGNVGKLARYCKSMYSYIPSHGERKLRMYFSLEKDGRAHLDTFNAIWPLYLKEYAKAERDSNIRIISEVS